jgi:hypothetical protein
MMAAIRQLGETKRLEYRRITVSELQITTGKSQHLCIKHDQPIQ